MTEYNYQHSFKLLRSIEGIVYKESFSSLFIIDGYDFFEAYRYRMFADIKGWRKREGIYGTQSVFGKIRVFFLNVFCLGVSISGTLQLIIFRKKILVYSPDVLSDVRKHHDFRLDEVYDFLNKNNLPHQEILHTNLNKTFLFNIFRRCRLPIYLESLNFLYDILGFFGFIEKVDLGPVDKVSLDEVDSIDRDLARLILKKYLTELQLSKFKVNVLTKVFRLSSVKLLLAIDDPRSYNELLVVTKRLGITSASFQHGHFTKYHVGWLSSHKTPHKSITPDNLYVWSSYWKDELVSLDSFFSNEVVKIAVPSRLSNFKSSTRKDFNKEGVVVLIPYETDAPKDEVKKYINAILTCPDTEVLFKIRTDIPEKKQCDEYGLIPGERVEIVKTLDRAIARADVVVGIYSTFLYDMLAYEIPVGILKTSMDYGEGMIRNSIAETVGIEDVCSTLERMKKTSKEVLSERRKKVYKESSPSIEDVLTESVASLIKKE